MVPIGVKRITHQSILWTILRKEWLKARKGSAAGATGRAATPTAMETTSICSTFGLRLVVAEPSVTGVEAWGPRRFARMMPLRKSSQEPVDDGAFAAVSATAV
jgi:hypothetical protein